MEKKSLCFYIYLYQTLSGFQFQYPQVKPEVNQIVQTKPEGFQNYSRRNGIIAIVVYKINEILQNWTK